MLKFQSQNKEQYSKRDSDNNRYVSNLTEKKKSWVCRNNHSTVKKREESQRKSEQKLTAVLKNRVSQMKRLKESLIFKFLKKSWQKF